MTTLIQWPHVLMHLAKSEKAHLIAGNGDAEKVLNFIQYLEHEITAARIKAENSERQMQLMSQTVTTLNGQLTVVRANLTRTTEDAPKKSKLKKRVRDLEEKYVEAFNAIYRRLDRLEDKE